MRTRRAPPRRGARVAGAGAALVLWCLLVSVPALGATASPSVRSVLEITPKAAGGAALPCTAPVNGSSYAQAQLGAWSYCIEAINFASGVPASQFINDNNSSAASAMVLGLASTPLLELSWWCGGPSVTLVSGAVFSLTLLSEHVIDDTIKIQGTNPNFRPCYQGLPLTQRSVFQNLTTLDSYSWVLSGVYSGSVTFYDDNGSVLGSVASFYVKVLPVIPPISIFTLPLMLVVVYELYQTVRDFRDLQAARPKRSKSARASKEGEGASESGRPAVSATTGATVASTGTTMAALPQPAGNAPNCEKCGRPTTWISAYGRYYCHPCATYAPKSASSSNSSVGVTTSPARATEPAPTVVAPSSPSAAPVAAAAPSFAPSSAAHAPAEEQRGPSPSTPAADTGANSTPSTPACASCGRATSFVPAYGRYYCYSCAKYVPRDSTTSVGSAAASTPTSSSTAVSAPSVSAPPVQQPSASPMRAASPMAPQPATATPATAPTPTGPPAQVGPNAPAAYAPPQATAAPSPAPTGAPPAQRSKWWKRKEASAPTPAAAPAPTAGTGAPTSPPPTATPPSAMPPPVQQGAPPSADSAHAPPGGVTPAAPTGPGPAPLPVAAPPPFSNERYGTAGYAPFPAFGQPLAQAPPPAAAQPAVPPTPAAAPPPPPPPPGPPVYSGPPEPPGPPPVGYPVTPPPPPPSKDRKRDPSASGGDGR